jgi:hypothetical protein
MSDVAAPAAPAAAPQAASMADFDSMMAGANTPTPWTEPQQSPAQKPAQQTKPTDPVELDTPEVDGPTEGAEQPEVDDGDGLLDDEPRTSAPEAITAAAEKWKAIEDSPELPPELGEKLWTVKPNGREMQVTIDEMAKGYMRLNESTRRSQQLDAREQQVTSGEQKFQNFFKSLEDPRNFLEVFERQLPDGVLDQALEIRRQRVEEDISLIEAAGYAVMRRLGVDKTDARVRDAMMATKARVERERKLDIELRRKEARNRELESSRQEVDTTARVAEIRATMERQLAQLTPTAFKAHRIRDNAVNRDRHTQYVKRLALQQGAQAITREIVAEAAKILREDLEDERVERTKQPAAAASKAAAPKGAGGGAAPTRGHVSNQSKSMADFDAHYGRQ